MKSQLIFYKSTKTALNEQALISALSFTGDIKLDAGISIDEKSLIKDIRELLKDNNIIFVVGDISGARGTAAVDVFIRNEKKFHDLCKFKRLKTVKDSNSNPGGYMFENQDSLIMFLKDDPNEISFMMSEYIITFIRDKYSLKIAKPHGTKNNMALSKQYIENHVRVFKRDRFLKNQNKGSRKVIAVIATLIVVLVAILLYFLSSR